MPTKEEKLKKIRQLTDPQGFALEQKNDQTNSHLSEILTTLKDKKENPDVIGTIQEFLNTLRGEKGDQGEAGKTPVKGVDYNDGYTPQRGVDYFTQDDIKFIRDNIATDEILKKATPIKGVHYGDGRNGIDGKDGKDGRNGKDGESIKGDKGDPGKDGKSVSAKDVIEALKKLPEEDKLDISHLRNFQSLLPPKGSGYKLTDQRWHGGGSNEAIISFIIDGGGSAITTGVVGDLAIQFDCTIQEVQMLADTTGSIVVDLWTASYANYPPTVANSIVASAKPTITNDIKSQDKTLTGWTKDLVMGNTLRYNVDSCSSITRCLVSLRVMKK